MRKKVLTLLTVFALLLSLCPTALAAEAEEVRETNFFTDENADRRTDLTFSELAKKLFDWYDNEFDYWENCIPLAHEILELSEDEANASAVKAKLQELDEVYINCRAVNQIGYIRYYQTYEDAYWDYYSDGYDFYFYLWYLLGGVSGKVLDSACAAAAEALIPDDMDRQDYTENADWYLDYACYTDYYPAETGEDSGTDTGAAPDDAGETDSEPADPGTAVSGLVDEYLSQMYEDFTATYEGKEWTTSSVSAALEAGEIDADTADVINREIQKNRNAVLGGIFVKTLPYQQQIAEDNGYGNYMEYLYESYYQRDYTYEEIQTFADALKAHIAPVYQAVAAIPVEKTDAFYADYAGDKGLDLIAPYLGQMSSELLESFTYMREHEMIDADWSDTKQLSSDSTNALYGYGTGFIIVDPSIAYSDNQLYNFDTIVHEFGHFNGNYWNNCTGGFFDYNTKPDNSMDICEVQSQGLELLMIQYYPEIFGEEAENVTTYKLSSMLYSLLYEAQCNEFETYAYTTPGVTLQQLNEKWLQLGIAYGFVDPDTPYTENYNWVTNPQLFHSAGYSISYSTSLAGSFTFYLDAQKDFFTGVDEYLEFCALPSDLGFQESFEKMGMETPIGPSYIEALGKLLAAEAAKLGADQNAPGEEPDEEPDEEPNEERAPASFTDVSGQWFAEAVLALANEGLVSGYADGAFRPDAPAVYGMLDPASDKADEAITRLEACLLLAEKLELTEEAVSTFPDTDNATVAALAELGVIAGYADGTFRPDQPMTRAELCTAWYRVLNT